VIFGVSQVSAVSNTWDDLLYTAKQAQFERLVVVIDEFPYPSPQVHFDVDPAAEPIEQATSPSKLSV
jgi:hypothetical protein